MPDWTKEVDLQDVEPDRFYFIAKTYGKSYDLYAEWGNGSRGWSCKPGIALHFPGKPTLIADVERLNENRDLTRNGGRIVLLAVPDDYARRWRARKVVRRIKR